MPPKKSSAKKAASVEIKSQPLGDGSSLKIAQLPGDSDERALEAMAALLNVGGSGKNINAALPKKCQDAFQEVKEWSEGLAGSTLIFAAESGPAPGGVAFAVIKDSAAVTWPQYAHNIQWYDVADEKKETQVPVDLKKTVVIDMICRAENVGPADFLRHVLNYLFKEGKLHVMAIAAPLARELTPAVLSGGTSPNVYIGKILEKARQLPGLFLRSSRAKPDAAPDLNRKKIMNLWVDHGFTLLVPIQQRVDNKKYQLGLEGKTARAFFYQELKTRHAPKEKKGAAAAAAAAKKAASPPRPAKKPATPPPPPRARTPSPPKKPASPARAAAKKAASPPPRARTPPRSRARSPSPRGGDTKRQRPPSPSPPRPVAGGGGGDEPVLDLPDVPTPGGRGGGQGAWQPTTPQPPTPVTPRRAAAAAAAAAAATVSRSPSGRRRQSSGRSPTTPKAPTPTSPRRPASCPPCPPVTPPSKRATSPRPPAKRAPSPPRPPAKRTPSPPRRPPSPPRPPARPPSPPAKRASRLPSPPRRPPSPPVPVPERNIPWNAPAGQKRYVRVLWVDPDDEDKVTVQWINGQVGNARARDIGQHMLGEYEDWLSEDGRRSRRRPKMNAADLAAERRRIRVAGVRTIVRCQDEVDGKNGGVIDNDLNNPTVMGNSACVADEAGTGCRAWIHERCFADDEEDITDDFNVQRAARRLGLII